jgi:hypothetical protein
VVEPRHRAVEVPASVRAASGAGRVQDARPVPEEREDRGELPGLSLTVQCDAFRYLDTTFVSSWRSGVCTFDGSTFTPSVCGVRSFYKSSITATDDPVNNGLTGFGEVPCEEVPIPAA